jgi:GxxExxY protein
VPFRSSLNEELFRGNKMGEELLYKELSYEIVNAAICVWKELGFGFLEKVYENALMVELQKRHIPCAQQKPIKVHYDNQIVGDYIADILIEEKILLELKSAKGIDDSHIAQVLNYLKATGIRLGIILNFGPEKMEFKRLIR